MAKESLEITMAGIRLSRRTEVPLYTQLYEQFRVMIVSGRLRPGERLPASRNLAKELGVSRVIISQGYEQLMMEGYLVGKTGSGTFVADTLPDHLLNVPKRGRTVRAAADQSGPGATRPGTRGAGLSGADVSGASATGAWAAGAGTNAADVSGRADGNASQTDRPPPSDDAGFAGDRMEVKPFQAGTPSLDQFPYKTWAATGSRVLKNMKSLHLGYEDTLGYMPLRMAIASYLRLSRAVKCEADQVIIVNGSQQGLNLIVAALLQRDDQVWMEDPGYPGARDAFRAGDVKICPVPMEEDGLNIRYAADHYPDAKAVYLTPSHQFPMGYTLSYDKRLEILQWAQQRKTWIIEDDYDSEFRYAGRPLASLQGLDDHGRVIYSGTFSKVLFPGLRLAYLVLPSVPMVNRFKEIKTNLDRQSPMMEQAILSGFMEAGHFLRHIRKMRLLYAERQQILIRLIGEQLGELLRVRETPSGMHLLCWLSPDIDIPRFRAAIRKEKLAISFINDFTIGEAITPAIILGFTAYSKYKMKIGIGKLADCLREAL